MSEDDRLELLRQRWERDPGSRIFLQLAEEHRRHGRLAEAVRILEKGLAAQPSYLSARVALGRCRLEVGDPQGACQMLETVLAADPTQLVANKLLIEAYVQTSQPDKARDRLDLYVLLNESDPELDELERRVIALESRPVAAVEPVLSDGAAETGASGPLPGEKAEAAEEIGAFEEAEEVGAFEASEPLDPREPAADADRAAVAPPGGPVPAPLSLPVLELAELRLDPIPVPGQARRRVGPGAGLRPLFPGLDRPEDSRRSLAGLIAEGIFRYRDGAARAREVEVAPVLAAIPESEVTLEEWSPAAPAIFELPPPAAGADEAAPSGASAGAEAAPVRPWWQLLEPPQVAPELPEAVAPAPEPAPVLVAVPAPEEEIVAEPQAARALEVEAPELEVPFEEEVELPPAISVGDTTATLGELYLRQGHIDEAEEAFRAVLSRDPGHLLAAAGLDEVGRKRRLLVASELLGQAAPSGLTARKIRVLQGYLVRIREGARRNVS